MGGFEYHGAAGGITYKANPTTYEGISHFPDAPVDGDMDESSPLLFDGDFTLRNLDVGFPAGWYEDGGGGNAVVVDGALRLERSYRVHNPVYIPFDCTGLRFDRQTISGAESDEFTVTARTTDGESVELWKEPVGVTSQSSTGRVVPVPAVLRGKVATITFGESGPLDPPFGVVAVDNVALVRGYIGGNEPADIVLFAPGVGTTTVERGSPVSIRWWDYDPDDNATITLYRDSDCDEGGQTAIAMVLEDRDGFGSCYPNGEGDCYEWNTGGVPFGTYRIRVMISDGVNAPSNSCSLGFVQIVPPNEGPTVALVTPAPGTAMVHAGESFTVQWTDSDLDDNASISLYYDLDCADGGGMEIVGDLREDPNGMGSCYPSGAGDCYQWNTTGVPPGTYQVRAKIDDGVNPAVWACSPGLVEVLPANEPPAIELATPVAGTTPVIAGDIFRIQWTDANPEENATIALYFDQDCAGDGNWTISNEVMEDPEGTGSCYYRKIRLGSA